MHVTRKDKNIAAIADAVGYRGRKIEIFPTTEVDVRSANYWDGGTRTTYTFLKLPSLEALNVPSMHPAYDQRVTRPLPLRPGMICVQHTIFCGKDAGITICVHPDELNTLMLPETPHLDENERIMLEYTRSYKNSYQGYTGWRFKKASENTGITLDQWNAASEALKERKLLTKAGAITAKGKNALEAALAVH